ncbi:MAG TPA: glycosyltransferase family A protein [Thermoanaerobaculia bacterium]|jgi:glycosyltransferase involved in cell wall biosynthesis
MGDPRPPRTYSVVIPAFKAGRTLGDAVRSALAQVPAPLEVVVVDDGSADGTRAVAEGFGAAVRVFTGPNAGPSSARNRGVGEARGSWIAFLDADDLFEPGYLAAAEEHLAANPDVGLLCFGVRVYEDGQRTAHVIHKKTPGPSYTTAGLLEGDVGTICTPLVARDVFLAAGGFDETLRGNEDCHLWLRLSRATALHQDPRVLLLYRRHEGNSSGDVLANARESVRSLELLEASHPEFAGEFRRPMRRLVGKENLRLGRELLVRGEDLPAARAALRKAVTDRPDRLRGWTYLAFAYVPGGPRLVAAFRRLELAFSRWWRAGSAAAAFRSLKRRLRAARA